MAVKHGLGRGLDALIKDGTPAATSHSLNEIRRVPLTGIRYGSMQPRHAFDAELLGELAESVRERGILQPLLVRAAGDGYELIAGERRLRAAELAGLAEVPVIVMQAADRDALELALIENLQRQDLNVLEEAEAYRVLADKFSLTQEQIAKRVGKARASVANAVRLLALPDEVRQMIADAALTPGHAKLLSGLDTVADQILYARRAAKEGLSVHQLTKLIERARRAPRKPRAARDDVPSSHIAYLSDRLHAHFGTGVRLVSSRTLANGKKARGVLEVDFYSSDDLDRILSLLGIREE